MDDPVINIIYPGFVAGAVGVTAANKSLGVDDESFIVDWSHPEYDKANEAFVKLTNAFRDLFGAAFIPQKNHHSTILSKRLDKVDLGPSCPPRAWRDTDFSETRQLFRQTIPDFCLTLDCCVLAPGGTIQLVFRDRVAMPRMRMRLVELGATVKSSTIDGDRINTCTVVLGFVSTVPDPPVKASDVSGILSGWQDAHLISTIRVVTVSLVQYFDLSLNRYIELHRFTE